ncbi:MAG: alginate export family protein, partial [Bacteriovoracaceae bacterium]
QKFVDQFKKEREELSSQLKKVKPKKKVAPAVVKKPKKVFKSKPIAKKVKSKRRKAITPTVMIDEKNLDLKLIRISNLLDFERENYLSLLKTSGDQNLVQQSKVNIEYLELERSKTSKLINMTERKSVNVESKEVQAKAFDYKGHFQFRTESADNQKGSQGTKQSEQSFFRLRADFIFKKNENLTFQLSPQAAKGFGQQENSVNTSGSTTHTEIDFYEANFDYKLFSSLSMKLGRQALAYGDHLIIGSLPWANNARSFDALKLKYKNSKGWTDLVYSKISDNSTVEASTDDTDLFVLYNSYNFGQFLNPIDLYLLHQDNRGSSNVEINTLGMRIKGGIGAFFYRTENGIQNGTNVGENAYQINLELGAKIKKFKLSTEYALAGEDYIQMYPTAHKFLGFADILGRRNIEQYAFHFKGPITSWLSFRTDYHIFKRNKTDKAAYSLGGVARTTNGTSDDIGDEIDVVLVFKTKDSLKFQLGGAWFMPGKYMKEQDSANRDETVRFVYGQINGAF